MSKPVDIDVEALRLAVDCLAHFATEDLCGPADRVDRVVRALRLLPDAVANDRPLTKEQCRDLDLGDDVGLWMLGACRLNPTVDEEFWALIGMSLSKFTAGESTWKGSAGLLQLMITGWGTGSDAANQGDRTPHEH